MDTYAPPGNLFQLGSGPTLPSAKTHLLHDFFLSLMSLGCFAGAFFKHVGSVVLDGGHTPGEHSQCHNTPAAQIQKNLVHCPGPETGPAPFMWCASFVDT